MAADLTRLLEKLNPDPGGEDVLKLRKATVAAVNSDGTVDLTFADGTTVDSVARLAGSTVTLGRQVQVITYLGALLVLGAVALDDDTASFSVPLVLTGNTTTGPAGAASPGQTSFTTAQAFGITFPGVPNVHVNLNSAAGTTSGWQVRAESVTTTGFVIFGYTTGGGITPPGFSADFQWTAVYSPLL